MPKKITHPFHKEHAFTLLTEPAYAEGLFNCDACGETGNGFSYHCKPCGIYLRILCAAMPLSLTHACHAHVSDFDDICKGPGRVPPVRPPAQNRNDTNFMAFQSRGPMPQQAAVCSRSAPWPNQPQVVRLQFAAAMPLPNFMPNPMINNAAVGVQQKQQ
ncbi:hypothetical protein Sango_0174000 [Sesamum angolense]|uniref:DC1 domain-containing protein n=1 Tax=Sesamum angolense TaxID=2727404 RepID=A0AAE1XFP6_9LAMI|nr:hypothetical protein Sango_0174000 [Sesamum angolense]